MLRRMLDAAPALLSAAIGLAQAAQAAPTAPATVTGTFAHETPDGSLTLTLRTDATFTLTQTDLPGLEGHVSLDGPAGGPWRLQLQPEGAREPLPKYALRALDAGRLGLSGGALVFEVVLMPAVGAPQ